MDKNKSNTWGQADNFRAQQLAWTGALPPTGAAPSATSGALLGPEEPPPGDARDVTHPTGSGTQSSRRQAADETLEFSAIVGAGTSFHGTLSFAGNVRIDGDFSGQILGGQLLVIGGEARVQGELRAGRVIILGGSVKADIYARDGIELYVPAQVTGDLRAPEIHLDRGVKFQGTCDLSESSQI